MFEVGSALQSSERMIVVGLRFGLAMLSVVRKGKEFVRVWYREGDFIFTTEVGILISMVVKGVQVGTEPAVQYSRGVEVLWAVKFVFSCKPGTVEILDTMLSCEEYENLEYNQRRPDLRLYTAI